ncbi:MAG: hypothetical protein AAF514_13300 [Verrucomicrobiota bacterium]
MKPFIQSLRGLFFYAGICLMAGCTTGHQGDPEAWSTKLRKIDQEKVEQDSDEYWNALERL